jgi:hypothetical protein
MHKRDYLVKQFEEFAKVLAVLLGLKRDEDFHGMNELINSTALKYAEIEIVYAEELDNENLINTLVHEKKLTDEQLKMLGDLLYEKGDYYSKINMDKEQESSNCFHKANMIYQFLLHHATLNYSLDMHYKLEVLSKMGFK